MLLSHGKYIYKGLDTNTVIALSFFSLSAFPDLHFLFCFLLKGFQCMVKLSWHSLYTCGTLRQRSQLSHVHVLFFE